MRITRNIATLNPIDTNNNVVTTMHVGTSRAGGSIDIDVGIVLGAGVGGSTGCVYVDGSEKDVMLVGNSVIVGNPGNVVINSLFVVYGMPVYAQQLRSLHTCGVSMSLRHVDSSPSPHSCNTRQSVCPYSDK